MAAPQVLYLRPKNKRGRPYRSIETLVERIARDTGRDITILNDRLFKVDGKYYFSQMDEYWTLSRSCIMLLEAYDLGSVVIGTIVYDIWEIENTGKFDYDNINVSFVFTKDGDLANVSQMAKIKLASPKYKELKCFNHIN